MRTNKNGVNKDQKDTVKKDGYNRGQHCVYCLTYHMIFVTHYRKPVINDEMSACVLSIENPQNRKENSPLSDREIPIIRKKHVESFRFFPYLVGKKAAFTAFCPIG